MKINPNFALACLSLAIFPLFANAKIISLSCPHFDSRASDLKIILDQDNGTASLQSASSGSGLNFTSQASFGPDQVIWRKDSKSYKQTFSVDRESLTFSRKTFSEATGGTYVDKSDCSIIKASKKAKF